MDAIARVANNSDWNPTVSFSAQAWARPGAVPTFNGAIVGTGRNGDEVFVIDHHAGDWRAFIRDSNRSDRRIHGQPIQPGVWTHLALTWDGQLLVFYVDGIQAGDVPVTNLNSSNAFLGIGGRSEEGFTDAELAFEFVGEIDEVAMFSRALTASEVQAIHAAGTLGSCRP